MKKIVSLFQRNYDGDRLVRNEVVHGAEWVAAGEGEATRKFDGTCCMVRGGKLFKRHEVKVGGKPPPDFEPANEIDENTGKQQGWVPVGDGPEDKYHREAFEFRNGECLKLGDIPLIDGTFELVGPKIQGNPEHFDRHDLVRHGWWVVGSEIAANPEKWDACPRDFDGIREYLRTHDIEGIVWHRGNGDMVKIKTKDFGIKRGAAANAERQVTP